MKERGRECDAHEMDNILDVRFGVKVKFEFRQNHIWESYLAEDSWCRSSLHCGEFSLSTTAVTRSLCVRHGDSGRKDSIVSMRRWPEVRQDGKLESSEDDERT